MAGGRSGGARVSYCCYFSFLHFFKRKNITIARNFTGPIQALFSKKKSKQAAVNILYIACKTMTNIPMTQKTQLLLIWTFLTAAVPRLGSTFEMSKLVPQQAPLTTTHETMSSTCCAISHTVGTHHMVEAAYLWSWTALFFSLSHTQTHFSPLFQLLFVERHYSPHSTAFFTARILSAYKRQLVC